jgi:hypothetical protein
VSYYLGRETLLVTGKSKMARWRKLLFSFLSRNARPATAFFGIPPNRVRRAGDPDRALILAVPDSRLETYRLVRAGDRATLTVTGAESREPHDLTVTHLTAWRPTAARTFHGTVTDDAAGLRLDLAEDGTDTVWRWRCQLADYPVAPADAVIVGTGVAGCGDAGTTTAPAVPTSVLACTDAIPDADLVAGIFAFGRAPGIELFALNDDCLHGSALRHIAPDGAIGRIR